MTTHYLGCCTYGESPKHNINYALASEDIAAYHSNLFRWVEDGEFRHDYFNWNEAALDEGKERNTLKGGD